MPPAAAGSDGRAAGAGWAARVGCASGGGGGGSRAGLRRGAGAAAAIAIGTVTMLSRSSFTSLVVGVFAVYVAHTCWVMYGIVYTRPCPAAADGAAGGCVWPYLARRPKLQVSGAGTARGPRRAAQGISAPPLPSVPVRAL